MKIEDCQTVYEFFGVDIHDYIWVGGKRFKVYRDALGGEQSAPNEASKALVGCLTGQLKWSKTEPINEFGSCDSCGYEFNSELISEYEIKYCPKCGQKIDEALTAEEEKLLREIAAQYPRLERLRLDSVGNIVTSYKSGAMYHPFGWKSEDSKAYTALTPTLKKYGEIDLGDYRKGNA